MNEQTTKLIQSLADKLGTTAGHLWAVLVRQAPMTSGIDLAVFLASCALAVFYIRWLIRLPEIDSNDAMDDLPKYIGRGSLYICAILLCGCLLSDLGNMSVTLSGFFNPEYWALKQILK